MTEERVDWPSAMTPLRLKILLHYYGCADDYQQGDFRYEAVREAIDDFNGSLGLLESWPDGERPPCFYQCYRLTARGRAYVNALLNTPLPVCKWTIPETAPKDAG